MQRAVRAKPKYLSKSKSINWTPNSCEMA
uniref:Uncharacterized protein n=1 Tax=Rhizophora mucronata TaxID=61149 RepID=A0A2P2KV13_RHIMU